VFGNSASFLTAAQVANVRQSVKRGQRWTMLAVGGK